jgi:serine phosphatase RsbU (regulator of sigma subunit)
MKRIIFLLTAIFLFSMPVMISAQETEEIDDITRATMILDIAKYITYDDSFEDKKEFAITIMDDDDDFYWNVDRLAMERKFVQGKPIRVYLLPKEEMLTETQMVYINKKDDYNIKQVLKKIEGWNTLLISEGYMFRESMINFMVVEGEPRFEANEELMTEHGLEVNELFLAQAIKTRDDWEQLFVVTDEELTEEKEVTRQQRIVITEQDSMIQAQIERLKALGEQIMVKEKELEEKIKTLFTKEKEIKSKSSEIAGKEKEIAVQKSRITEQTREMAQQKEVLTEQQGKISEREAVISERDKEIQANEERIAIQLEAIQKQKLVIIAAIVALVLLLGLAYFIFVNYRNKKKANLLLEEKNILIEKQKDEAENQRDQIAYQKQHITDSIMYAQKIQRAILPSMELFSDKIDHFVLYKPRDIVSGDFYWVDRKDNMQIIITADCTGHGVPGAFMSMLGVSLLNEIINNRKIISPHEILNNLRSLIIDSLNQRREASEIKDGMDITVSVIDYEKDKLYFAGANNPLYFIRDGELEQYKADKMPVAIYDIMDDYKLTTIDLKKGDTFYTFSDGYVDQFGGPAQKKFLSKNFKRVLLEIQDLPMIDQGKKLDEIFEEYKAEVEQVDDVVVIGVRY